MEIYLKVIMSGKPIWDYDFLVYPVRNNAPLGFESRYSGTEISKSMGLKWYDRLHGKALRAF